MDWTLKRHPEIPPPQGPVVVVVMDGVGHAPEGPGNAVTLAHTPTLDRLRQTYPHMLLKAHGTAVGLPSDKDMGNSEVGHNALGAGRIIDQGAKLVSKAIASRKIFETATWKTIVERGRSGGALHLIGLLSDGNVHSHIDHLFNLIQAAAQAELGKVYVHVLLDGRDVPETSALQYVGALEQELARHHSPDKDYRIASGGGRMLVTMDRYGADWSVVERGWKAHVHGEGHPFGSTTEAIETLRKKDPGVIDQFLPAFVITKHGKPVGKINDGDSVVFFNFRGDRAIEISQAFEQESFRHFDRGARPDAFYAGMTLYDGDRHVPSHYLVEPPSIHATMGEYLARNKMRQVACAETQKFGHVTYFWNGNRSGTFDETLETYIEVPSDLAPFDQRPWMKAAEVTDAFIEALRANKPHFARVNYANGDMVGHTGILRSAIMAVEAVDLCLERLVDAIVEMDGIVLVTADHGNADEMYDLDSKTRAILEDEQGRPRTRTAHSLNPVPLILVSKDNDFRLRTDLAKPGLPNIAATALNIMGFVAPDSYEPSLLETTKEAV
ncbi:MAG: 2,3-bisphosphoglycerate-independent phosphoglycerate mutase [Deltaproteobacteria bacterium]|nr:2,3-bisphosphoglycerate-independent phosphoglycerate mutase [Deltaproteobacteria bacterium]